MNVVKFYYNLEKDARVWVLIARHNPAWGENYKASVRHIPNDLLKKILKNSQAKAKKIVIEYLKNHPKRRYKERIIKEEIKALEKIWRIKEKNYFRILEKITQNPIYRKEFKAYFTSGFMCPYDEKENWFMVSMWRSTPFSITTICHEILHLQFLHYYKKWCFKKGLTKTKLEDLKEALTFVLNEPEFKDIILVEDVGYPKHQKLRTKLKKIWQKEKDFKVFLEKAIKLLK